MGRKKQTAAERIALANSRGCTVASMQTRDLNTNEIEFTTLANPTQEKHQDAIDVWEEFHLARGIEVEKTLLPNQPIPSISKFKNFVEYYAASRHGRRSDMPTVSSIMNLWYRFTGAYRRATNVKIGTEITNDITSFIQGTLREKLRLSNKKDPRYLVTRKDLVVMIEYLWTVDDHEYRHERYRVQLAFMLQLFCFSGARAGAIVESSSYRGTNEAITYKDVQVHLIRQSNGKALFHLTVCQRYVKGKRLDENDNITVPMREHDSLQYNPVLSFFSIALADHAFKDIEDIHALQKVKLPEGRDSWQIEWKACVLDLPVLRMAPSETEDRRALSYAALWSQLVELGKRVGYRDAVKVHNIRRGVANKLDKNFTEAERNKLLGQTTGVYARHYASDLSGVDAQASFLGETIRTEHIETMQSMDHRRDRHAPRSLRGKEKIEFEESPEIVALNNQISEITSTIGGKLAEHLALLKDRQKLYTKKSNLQKKWKAKCRGTWFKNSYGEEIRKQLQEDCVQGAEKPLSLFPMVQKLLPTRDRLATALFKSKDMQSQEGQKVLQDLVSLCCDDSQVAYRPGEYPIDGICPCKGCLVKITSLPPQLRSKHINRCCQRELRMSSQQPSQFSRSRRHRKHPFTEYCYACTKWCCSEEDWDTHCESHLAKPTLRCGQLTFRHTLAAAGYCPFCLGDETLKPRQRVQQWVTKATLLNHIDEHIDEHTRQLKGIGEINCPHPLCHVSFSTMLDFRCHLFDDHSIEEPRSNCLSRKRKCDDGDEESEPKKVCKIPSNPRVKVDLDIILEHSAAFGNELS